jgi:hypothetical protein
MKPSPALPPDGLAVTEKTPIVNLIVTVTDSQAYKFWSCFDAESESVTVEPAQNQ